jgi:serine/threonine protein kinase
MLGGAGGTGAAVSHYAVGKTIGEGTFGKVKKGIHKLTGVPVAIKILEKDKIVDLADVERVKREIHILIRIDHPNVIRLYEVIDSPKHIFLIMEFAPGGELFDHIVACGRVKEREACRFLHQIVNGVDYCHKQGVIHRDLKPENLLLDKITGIKIVDFGLGNLAQEGTLLKTACGSPCYAAPEMIAGKRYHGPGVDMWSLGVILFALLCGYLPFEDANTTKLYEKIMGGHYELPDFLSQGGADLIQKLLTTDPKRRFTVAQVRKHPWYASQAVKTDPSNLWATSRSDDPAFAAFYEGYSKDDPQEVDADILRHMVMIGYNRQQVLDSVVQRKHDHFAATYSLLLAKRRMSALTDSDTPRSKSQTSRLQAVPPIAQTPDAIERPRPVPNSKLNPLSNPPAHPTDSFGETAQPRPPSHPPATDRTHRARAPRRSSVEKAHGSVTARGDKMGSTYTPGKELPEPSPKLPREAFRPQPPPPTEASRPRDRNMGRPPPRTRPTTSQQPAKSNQPPPLPPPRAPFVVPDILEEGKRPQESGEAPLSITPELPTNDIDVSHHTTAAGANVLEKIGSAVDGKEWKREEPESDEGSVLEAMENLTLANGHHTQVHHTHVQKLSDHASSAVPVLSS